MEEAKGYAELKKLLFIETSALENSNVEEAFSQLISHIYENTASEDITSDNKPATPGPSTGGTVVINPPKETAHVDEKKGGCCK